jgi:hypothetical protein
MPVLWRAYDRHRVLRARLPAELAADTDQDRHLMSQTSGERCGFPIPMRWLHPGGDLSQPNHTYQCTDRTLMRSEHQPKCLQHSPKSAKHNPMVPRISRRNTGAMMANSTAVVPSWLRYMDLR